MQDISRFRLTVSFPDITSGLTVTDMQLTINMVRSLNVVFSSTVSPTDAEIQNIIVNFGDPQVAIYLQACQDVNGKYLFADYNSLSGALQNNQSLRDGLRAATAHFSAAYLINSKVGQIEQQQKIAKQHEDTAIRILTLLLKPQVLTTMNTSSSTTGTASDYVSMYFSMAPQVIFNNNILNDLVPYPYITLVRNKQRAQAVLNYGGRVSTVEFANGDNSIDIISKISDQINSEPNLNLITVPHQDNDTPTTIVKFGYSSIQDFSADQQSILLSAQNYMPVSIDELRIHGRLLDALQDTEAVTIYLQRLTNGKGTITLGSNTSFDNIYTVTGTSTLFTQEVSLGDSIIVNGNTYQVVNITSDTDLEIKSLSGTPSFTAASYTIQEPGIPEVVYGTQHDYNTLTKTGPYGLLINITNSNGTVVTTNTNANSVINTFYFSGTTTATRTLQYRISTTPSGAIPPQGIYTINVTTGTTAEQLVLLLLNDIYSNRNTNFLLGALTSISTAIQMTGFRRTDPQYQLIIDILVVPTGITFARGTTSVVRGSFSTSAKSLILDTSLAAGNVSNDVSPNTGIPVGTLISKYKPNSDMQRVLDRINDSYGLRGY